jgi:site-specific recombinase XerD
MAKVFCPDEARLKALGFEPVAHVPVLFDAEHRYCREHNRYLRERATLQWHPSGELTRSKRIIDLPARKSLINIARNLGNFIDWCKTNELRWQDLSYDAVLRYQDDQAAGQWSQNGRRLKPGIRNQRADDATHFLRWAAERKLRPRFEIKLVATSRSFRTGSRRRSLVRHVRAGRAKISQTDQVAAALSLPNANEVADWLRAVREKRGHAKQLACRLIIEAGTRRAETAELTEDRWPSVDMLDDLQARGRFTAPVELTKTKGDRPRTIQVPLPFAREVRLWMDGSRLVLRQRYFKRECKHASPRLFLSDRPDFEGIPISAQTIYDCFHRVTPRPSRWHPHFGRHAFAGFFLLQILDLEAKAYSKGIAAMGADWVMSRGQYWLQMLRRQFGHASDDTTELYLRWLTTSTQLPDLVNGWHALIDCDREQAR